MNAIKEHNAMTSSAPTASFSSDLSIPEAMDYVLREARTLGADAADALVVEGTDMSVTIREGKTETVQRAESAGLGLRVLVGKRQAMVSVSDRLPHHLKELAVKAVAMAKAVPEDPFVSLASEAQWVKAIPELDLYDANEPSMELLIQQAMQTESLAMSAPGITNSEGAEAGYGKSTVWLASSYGFMQSYTTSFSSLSVSVVAGDADSMERDYAYHTVRHREDLKSSEVLAKEAVERTLARLHPRQPCTMQAPIVFEPRVAKSLIGSFISAINGAAIARGTSFLKEALHHQIFPSCVTIVNEPHRVRGIGSRPFDAEGLPAEKRAIIDGGVLTSWLLDLRSANQLGLVSTGNAVRGIGSAPHPAAHNVYMEAGSCSMQDMIGTIKQGLYVTETFGSGVNLVTGDYSQGASGFWIENGVVAYPVSELTIAGNMRDMFKQLIPANDLVFEYQINVPTLRIDGMTIAGKS